MAKIKGAIVVDTERCKGCNLCVAQFRGISVATSSPARFI